MLGGEAHRELLPLALHGLHVAVQEPSKLAGMRRQDEWRGPASQALRVMLQGVEAIRIEHDRSLNLS
jgi:hypothetical protein